MWSGRERAVVSLSRNGAAYGQRHRVRKWGSCGLGPALNGAPPTGQLEHFVQSETDGTVQHRQSNAVVFIAVNSSALLSSERVDRFQTVAKIKEERSGVKFVSRDSRC